MAQQDGKEADPGDGDEDDEAEDEDEAEATKYWRKWGAAELESALASGAVRLLDAEYVKALDEDGGVLRPRQCLPQDAFIPLDKLRRAAHHRYGLPVVVVSHCWLQADHPDPRGFNLRKIARALRQDRFLSKKFGKGLGVFIDFSCLFQACRDQDGVPQERTFAWDEDKQQLAGGALGRTQEEATLFAEGLRALNVFYSHPWTRVLKLTALPPDYETAYAHKNGTVGAPYGGRGWCHCEAAMAGLVKQSRYVLDLGAAPGDRLAARARAPPCLPAEFAAQLARMRFTNGKTDRPLVARLYKDALALRLGAATKLFFNNLSWGDAEAAHLAAVLRAYHPPRLQLLDLDGNTIGPVGAAALADALPHVPALERLHLNQSPLGDAGAVALARALPHLPRLERLSVSDTGLGDAGATALATAVARMPALKALWMRGNPSVGATGRAAVRAACEAHVPPVELHM